jgi:hypothetical protein
MKILHNEELHDLSSSSNIALVIEIRGSNCENRKRKRQIKILRLQAGFEGTMMGFCEHGNNTLCCIIFIRVGNYLPAE